MSCHSCSRGHEQKNVISRYISVIQAGGPRVGVQHNQHIVNLLHSETCFGIFVFCGVVLRSLSSQTEHGSHVRIIVVGITIPSRKSPKILRVNTRIEQQPQLVKRFFIRRARAFAEV